MAVEREARIKFLVFTRQVLPLLSLAQGSAPGQRQELKRTLGQKFLNLKEEK
jgi:hypothetical protein